MKPSKSKTNKIKIENKPSSSSTIQDFLKTAPKECVERTGLTASDNKAVYIKALKDQLKSYDDDETGSNCLTNSSDLRRESDGGTIVLATERSDEKELNTCDGCGEWRVKYEELKKSYIKLSLRHSDLLMKHDELLQTATNTVRSNSDEQTDDVSETMSTSDVTFTANEIRCLQGLPLDKKKDSNFILQCCQYAYKNDASKLLTKTLKGTLEKIEIKDDGNVVIHPPKSPLTPEKVKRIQELFVDRVSKSKCNAVEFGERVKQTNINKLLASAIKNISNKEKPNEKVSNGNAHLNL